MIKESNHIENEIIFIERTISSMNLTDRILFLISRLYKNFYTDLNDKRTSYDINNVKTHNKNILENIEETDFLNICGNNKIKSHILNYFSDTYNNLIFPLFQQFGRNYLITLANKKPLLLDNKEHLLLAPFIYNLEILKSIIIHELSLINISDFEHYINKIEGVLNEITIRVGKSKAWDLFNEMNREYQFNFPKEITDINFETGEETIIGFDYGESKKMYAEFLGIEKRTVVNFEKLIEWLKNLDKRKIVERSKKLQATKNKAKLFYKKSPLKLSELFIYFFEKNNVTIDSDKKERINRFILNCIDYQDKYPKVANSGFDSINFLNKKTLLPFVSLIVYLMKKQVMKETSASGLKDILKKELQSINKHYIGLSDNLRNIITEKLSNIPNSKVTDLLRFANLDNIQEVDGLIKS